MNAKISLVNGNKNEGKTTQIKKLVVDLILEGKSVIGFYSEKVFVNEFVIGYDLVTVPQGEVFSFLRINKESAQKIGPFYINLYTLDIGLFQLQMAIDNKVDIVVLDEVGKLELIDKGWATGIEELLKLFEGEIIMSVRAKFLKQIIQKWKIEKFNNFSLKNKK